MNRLLIAATFLTPVAFIALGSAPAHAQNWGPASDKHDYHPPGSWLPGQTGSRQTEKVSTIGDDGCEYEQIFDVVYEHGEVVSRTYVETLKFCPPPPPPPEPPAQATTGGVQEPAGDPPPPPAVVTPPPTVTPPAPPPPAVKPPATPSGFVTPPAAPPVTPPPPGRWERFKKWCRELFECQTEAEEAEEHKQALEKARQERRAQSSQGAASDKSSTLAPTHPTATAESRQDHAMRAATLEHYEDARSSLALAATPTASGLHEEAGHMARSAHTTTPSIMHETFAHTTNLGHMTQTPAMHETVSHMSDFARSAPMRTTSMGATKMGNAGGMRMASGGHARFGGFGGGMGGMGAMGIAGGVGLLGGFLGN